MYVVFFFQAEEGIRYSSVTGVQTCALPILRSVNFSSSTFLANPGNSASHANRSDTICPRVSSPLLASKSAGSIRSYRSRSPCQNGVFGERSGGGTRGRCPRVCGGGAAGRPPDQTGRVGPP